MCSGVWRPSEAPNCWRVAPFFWRWSWRGAFGLEGGHCSRSAKNQFPRFDFFLEMAIVQSICWKQNRWILSQEAIPALAASGSGHLVRLRFCNSWREKLSQQMKHEESSGLTVVFVGDDKSGWPCVNHNVYCVMMDSWVQLHWWGGCFWDGDRSLLTWHRAEGEVPPNQMQQRVAWKDSGSRGPAFGWFWPLLKLFKSQGWFVEPWGLPMPENVEMRNIFVTPKPKQVPAVGHLEWVTLIQTILQTWQAEWNYIKSRLLLAIPLRVFLMFFVSHLSFTVWCQFKDWGTNFLCAGQNIKFATCNLYIWLKAFEAIIGA